MCGIAGIMTRNGTQPESSLLDSLMDGIAHRGPDGSGRHVGADTAMVQTRLAIIDLQTGDQPFYEPNGAALIANGEIYNYVELRRDMPDTPFQTESDCETALFLYRQHGVRYTEHLRGMYAIAIHDPSEGGSLIISRDPFGIKPLYFVETADAFLFASEPNALLKTGLVSPGIDASGREIFLQMQFSSGRTSPLRDIQRVLPGETLVIRKGRIVSRHRQAALPDGGPEDITEEAAIARLDDALRDSVAVHQRSDVPYGLFLSGGIDSSVLLGLMAELNTQPVVAFTAGFDASTVHDERDHARKLAKQLGAVHEEISFGHQEFDRMLPRIAGAMDDPAADYAILPTWALAERAARDLKVVLSGEGGDEIFAGYGRYRSVLRPWWLGGKSVRNRGVFDGMGILRWDAAMWRDHIFGQEARDRSQGRNRLQIAQAIDCEAWLPNDLLTKLDRCLMAHGVEGRTPFLDPRVAESAFRLPDRLKIQDRRGKWILRRWLDKLLPEAEAFAPKRGFTVPVGFWISEAGSRLGNAIAELECIQEIAYPDRVRDAFKSASKKRLGQAAWVLLFYALWHKAMIERVDTRDATILEALSAK